jgi:hypothetical protein
MPDANGSDLGIGSAGDVPGFGGGGRIGASGLDIFSGPEIEPYLKSRKEVVVYPDRPLNDPSGPFKFDVLSDGDRVRKRERKGERKQNANIFSLFSVY